MNKLLTSLLTLVMLFSIGGCKTKDFSSIDKIEETEQIEESTDSSDKTNEPIIILISSKP